MACRNFVQLCMEGYYNGTIFHRIIKGNHNAVNFVCLFKARGWQWQSDYLLSIDQYITLAIQFL